MARKDVALENYFQDNERYADLLNGFLFEGRQVVRAEEVKEQDSSVKTVIRRPQGRLVSQKYRDMIRRVAMGMNFVIAGVEHQDQIHYAMPIRIMMMDAAMYDKQLRGIQKKHRKNGDLKSAEYLSGFSRHGRILPVFTIVLYYGEEEWTGARDLYSLMDYESLPEPVKGMLNNYRIHVLEVQRFRDVERFQTDLKEVFRFLQGTKDKALLEKVVSGEEFTHLDDDAYELMAALGEIPELDSLKEKYQGDGGVNMCKAFDELMKDKEMQGEKRGEIRGEKRGEKRGEIRGEIRGEKRGEVRGDRRRAERTAYNLFLRKMTVEDTAAITELEVETVKSLFKGWRK